MTAPHRAIKAVKATRAKAAKLKPRLDLLQDMYLHPEHYERNITQWEVKELKQYRPHLWNGGEQKSIGNAAVAENVVAAGMVIPKSISSAADLARFLHNYFKDRISLTIDQTRICQWRKGLMLGQVVVDGKLVKPPSFPNKNESGNRWTTQTVIDWMEKWIVPQKRVDGHGMGVAADFDRIKQEHAIWQMQREKDVANGRFKSVEIFEKRATIIGAAINNAISEAEAEIKISLAKKILTFCGTIEQGALSLIDAEIVSAVNEEFDRLRGSVRKAITDAPDWDVETAK